MKTLVQYTGAWLLALMVKLASAQTVPTLSKQFVLDGAIVKPQLAWVHLEYIDASSHFIHDSSRLVNGRFYFRGSLVGAVQASLYQTTDQQANPQDASFTYFFLEPGKQSATIVAGKFKAARFVGSANQAQYASFTQTAGVYPFYLKKENLIKRFVRQHPHSYVSASLLQTQLFRLSLDTLDDYFGILHPSIQQSADGKLIADYLTKEHRTAPGQPAPAFEERDTKGTLMNLESYKGKYLLLDFWAAWCIPCRQQNPYLRQANTLFKEKGLNLISFSLDEDTAAWKRAIVKDTLSWPQVLLTDIVHNKTAIAYNIAGKGIPYNYLINPAGTIVATDLRGDELIQKLQQYLK